MKKYKFSFTGRQTGAIGIFYPITETYEAQSEAEAVNMLMKDYEHISALTLNGKDFKITDKHFKIVFKYEGMEKTFKRPRK